MPTTTEAYQNINMAAASDVGTVRQENEDSFYYSQAKKFFVICDGMGGHQKGAAASRFACETLRDFFFANNSVENLVLGGKVFDAKKACEDLGDLPDAALKMIAAIRLANRRLIANSLSDKKMQGMGTTTLAAHFHEGMILFAHVGDSRLYRLRGGQLQRLTMDHSWLNELIEDNEISQKDAEQFKKKNVLTRALGMAAQTKIDFHIESVLPGDIYLTCTDGLYNALSDDLIQSILTAYQGSLQSKVDHLVERAKAINGSDNITAGLIHASGESDTITEPIKEKVTIPEESEAVVEFLDQAVKNIYPVKTNSSGISGKKVGAIVGIAATAVAAALLLFHTSEAQKRRPATEQTALFTQEVSPYVPSVQKGKNANEAGYVVLVQVGDIKFLHKLEDIPGIRVLDTVSKLKSGAPLSAGTYTWAMADSRENILYKGEDIQLESAEDIPLSTSPKLAELTTDTNAEQNATPEGENKNHALIFLVGDFQLEEYSGASIYVDDKLFGSLSRFKDSGFRLAAGRHDIKIVGRNKALLRQKSNVEINPGETIAIEF